MRRRGVRERWFNVLKCTMMRDTVSKDIRFAGKITRTLVINGVTNKEKTKDGGDDGLSRGVLAIEISGLESTDSRSRCWALGQLGVKVDKRCQTFTLSR